MSTHLKHRFLSSPRSHTRTRAFTLVELLSVVAVMGVMAAMVLPSLLGARSAADVNAAALEVASCLEHARAYAMANNTYVFVGVTERDGRDSDKPGVGQILVVAMGSRDGTRSFGTGGANLAPLSPLRRYRNVSLEDVLPNTGAMSRPDVQDRYRVANQAFASTGTFTAFGHAFTRIVQFDPRGTAGTPSAGAASPPQWMELGLTATHGNVARDGANYAALVVDGVTGSAKIYRP